MRMTIAIPDMISNSYFPAAAAVELGFCKEEGLDIGLELIPPVDRTLEELRDGKIHFVGGSAHSVPHAFPEWQGGKVICAQAQHMYWFLILKKSLGAKKGEIDKVKGLSIGAAPLVNLGLKQLLKESGIDEAKDGVKIGPVPGAFLGPNKNFGVAAAKALEAGLIDGFWANGMGAEVAVTSGAGTMVIDARRGDGPPKAKYYTMAAIMTSDKVIKDHPNETAAMVRAIVKTQKALKADVSLATKVGQKLFPEHEASLIAELIRRDLPYYDPTVSREFVAGMTEFQRNVGLINGNPKYEDVVESSVVKYWS
jgi:NitT/TauT family transport system substrate-binding protein